MVFEGDTSVSQGHDVLMVITLTVANYEFNRVLVDTRSSIYVVCCNCFPMLVQKDKGMSPALYLTMGFIKHTIYLKGLIELSTKVGT